MDATFVSGPSFAFDYTPASAVTAGQVIVQLGLVGCAKSDIAANRKGALHTGGIWAFAAEDSHAAIPVGTDIFWDDDGNPQGGTAGDGCATTTDTGVFLGKAVPKHDDVASADASAASEATVNVVMLVPEGNAEAS